ncbi:MAG: membrane protein insertase YidC [Alphaproteobacteria bacterium]|nr:membrane protein insertase YidC [Alphaproteobacteria bacterium]
MNNNIMQEKAEQRNMMWALLFVTIILFGANVFVPSEQSSQPQEVVEQIQSTPSASLTQVPSLTEMVALSVPVVEQNIALKNDFVVGNYNTVTSGINHLDLLKYRETTQKNSPNVTLLTDTYQTKISWTSPHVVIPTPVSSTDTAEVTTNQPVQLQAKHDSIQINRTVSLDNAYMLNVTDTLTNLSDKPIDVVFQAEIERKLLTETGISNVHEGFVAVLKDKLIEEKYDDDVFSEKTKGGWFGITDKYWQTAFVLENKERGKVEFEQTADKTYVARFIGEKITIPAGQTYTHVSRTFAGAKDIELLTKYQDEHNIPKFDLTIDFGWFYFLTKPFLYLLNWLYDLLGNMGVAILVFATLIRLALLPIATKSYESMARMRKVQPKLAALQARYKDDKQRLQIEMMNLYKREKVNPMSGCLPLLLQIPIFYALYKVLSVAINMRQAPFFGWITDLSVPDPLSIFTGFGYFDWSVPTLLNIGIWPILMGITMYVQQKLSPAPTDPTQAKVMKWFPIVFTFMLGGFAAGLVIYWTWSNILSILQQKYIMHKVGVK